MRLLSPQMIVVLELEPPPAATTTKFAVVVRRLATIASAKGLDRAVDVALSVCRMSCTYPSAVRKRRRRRRFHHLRRRHRHCWRKRRSRFCRYCRRRRQYCHRPPRRGGHSGCPSCRDAPCSSVVASELFVPKKCPPPSSSSSSYPPSPPSSPPFPSPGDFVMQGAPR